MLATEDSILQPSSVLPPRAPAAREVDAGSAYETRLFVPPPPEILARVYAKVEKWDKSWQVLRSAAAVPVPSRAGQARLRGSPLAPGDQVLYLAGECGAGKTWLLRHLADPSGGMPPLTVYLDLDRRAEFTTADGYVQAVEGLIQQQCGKGRAILLLDAVPPVLDEPLRALEDRVLRPHLAQRESLLIMALIHPSLVCWRAPALRGGESLERVFLRSVGGGALRKHS